MTARGPINHGTWWAYRGRGCRCGECRGRAAEYRREARWKAMGLAAPPADDCCPFCQFRFSRVGLGHHLKWCPDRPVEVAS